MRHAADGVDPVTAGCVKDARLIETSPVMLGGSQIGMVELIYSVRCAASWARIYLPPGQPDMLGEVTVRASDGRLATFANPLIEQVPVDTDVITQGGSGCLAAEASSVLRAAHMPPSRFPAGSQSPDLNTGG